MNETEIRIEATKQISNFEVESRTPENIWHEVCKLIEAGQCDKEVAARILKNKYVIIERIYRESK